MKKAVLGCILICAFNLVTGQEKTFPILGKVIDSATRQPLHNASVFCQNTTYGTISNSEGNFFMRLPAGGYDLVVSYTGYEKQVIRISNNSATKDTMVIELVTQNKALEEVAIVVSNEVPDGWLKYGKFFTEQFIGTTPNAELCIIQNPEALRFFFSKKRQRLKVTAKEELVIINHALGYKLKYQLDSFSYEYSTNMSQYTGNPFFQEMDTTEDVKQKWITNRARAYLGSRLHFMHSLYDQTVKEEGFVIEKMSDESKSIAGKEIVDLYDSTQYISDSSQAEILWIGRYRISYKPVLPEKKFLEEFKLPSNSRAQVTILEVADGFIIEENGYFYEQYEVINSGYWAWKKLAELLPYDYVYE